MKLVNAQRLLGTHAAFSTSTAKTINALRTLLVVRIQKRVLSAASASLSMGRLAGLRAFGARLPKALSHLDR